MIRKTVFALGILLSTASFVLDQTATNAEACGGCRRRSCCSSGCSTGCCPTTTYYAAPAPCCTSSCGSCCYAPTTCCTSGCVAVYGAPAYYPYAIQGGYAPAYAYTMPAPTGPYYSSYAAPITSVRTKSVYRFALFSR